MLDTATPIEVQQLVGPNSHRLTPATLANVLSRGYWLPARHLLYLSAKIATEIAKGNARIIVCMPPRHGKSELLSVWTSVWALDRDPRNEIILASYGAELADDFGQKARDIILEDNSPEGLGKLRCILRRDSLRINRFLTNVGGGMRSIGMGGTIVGRGADLFFIDDYIKNAKEAASEGINNDNFEWFLSTARTRMEPGGSIIIIAQRWGMRDLIGRVQENSKGWTIIKLPAIALEGDPLGRKPGEALWPERYSIEVLQQIKEELGSYFWESLYQQTPIPRSSKIITLEILDIVPAAQTLDCVRFWDLAATEEDGDWTVGALMGRDRASGFIYILDVLRIQGSPGKVETLIKTTAALDGSAVRIAIEQEPGAAGKTVVDMYNRLILPAYSVDAVRGSGDKFIKASPFLAKCESGLVILKRGEWNVKFIEEIRLFAPTCENDDQVDAAAGAYNQLFVKKSYAGTWGRDVDENLNQGSLIQGVVWGK